MSGDPAAHLAPVVRLAPAKLNLTLAVMGRRADGYHDLHSVAVPLDLADRLSVGRSTARDDTLHVVGPDTGADASNLVLRAIAAVRSAVARMTPAPPLAARLEKRIPVSAGLGGGSSDAAAALEAALESWAIEPTTVDLGALAASLGSDVSFFLVHAPALLEGRGERVTSLAGVRGAPPGIVLVTPAVGLPTAAVFDAYAGGAAPTTRGSTRLTSEHLAAELRRGLTAAELVARAGVLATANDLAAAAASLLPGLLPFRRAVARLLGRPVGLSGSGPTLWTLYPSLDAAADAATTIRAAIASGRLEPPGAAQPFVAATTISSPAGSGWPHVPEGGRR